MNNNMKCIICSGEMKKIPLINEISRYNGKKYPLFKCTECGFCRPKPLPFEDHSAIDFYDEGSHIKFFDKRLKDIDRESKEYKYYFKHFEPFMKLIGKYKMKGKSLDIGSGPGHLMELERDAGIDVEGMEVSKLLVKLLTKRGFKMHYGLLGQIKLPKYDIITMNQVLEHIEKPEEAVIEINKAMKNGGYCIIAVPYLYGVIPKILRSKWYGLGYGQHLNFFSKESMKILFERNGFKVEEMQLLSLDYAHPNFPFFVNWIANLIMRINVVLGISDDLFVVIQKVKEIKK